jgi:alcohol dehydrogenase class IV
MSTKYFRIAESIVYGWGAFEYLKTVQCSRALIVTGQGTMEKLGYLAKATSYLKESGAKVYIINGIQPEPQIENIASHLDATLDFQPDTFVALGGGSVIDSAKALWALYEHPDLDIQELFKPYVSQPYPLHKMGSKARLIAIPSTSGTGSETSAVAVLFETRSKIKRVLLSAGITPNIAIIDPEIPSHMPPQLSAHTGLDALTHALESIISPWSNVFSEPLATNALVLIFQNLRAACVGSNQDAREKMHYASTLAGMAINNSITGLAHGLDKIGQYFDLPHGLTCAVLLPYTMAFNISEAKPRYAAIAKNIGLAGKNEEYLAVSLINHLIQLEIDIGIAQNFQELGIEEDQYIEKIALVSEYALKAGPTVFSPKVPSPDELKQLYLNAYHGVLPI